MSLFTFIQDQYTRFQRARLELKLDEAANNEDETKLLQAVHKGLTKPRLADVVMPEHVAIALSLLVEEADGAGFTKLGAALVGKPDKLKMVDSETIAQGIHAAVSDGVVDNNLLATIAAFEASPHHQKMVADGLGSGVMDLVSSNTVSNSDIATTLLTLTDGPLGAKAPYAENIQKGVVYGVGTVIEEYGVMTTSDILDEVQSQGKEAGIDVTALERCFTKGVEFAMEPMAFTDPQQVRSHVNNLSDTPVLVAGITERHVQNAARNILRSHTDEEDRCQFADFKEEARLVPHLAFAIASMPESERLVTFTAVQTGSGYPMVVEATPREGIRITTGCRVNETPQERIEAWLEHDEESRREETIPCVFEAVAKLTQSPYQHRAADARAELDVLSTRYIEEWADKLPEAARTRIAKVLPSPAAA